jgi:hypothetical protein
MAGKQAAGTIPVRTFQVRLTDDEWGRIAKFSGLPVVARKIIERDIGFFHELQAMDSGGAPPALTRKQLQRLRRDVLSLVRRIKMVIANDDAYFALTVRPQQDWHPRSIDERNRLPEHRRLMQALDELVKLADWFAVAAEKIKAGKQGPDTFNAYLLVERLDRTLENYTGQRIARSTKRDTSVDYVTAVCLIADPKIGRGTIDSAMKSVISGWRRWDAFEKQRITEERAPAYKPADKKRAPKPT